MYRLADRGSLTPGKNKALTQVGAFLVIRQTGVRFGQESLSGMKENMEGVSFAGIKPKMVATSTISTNKGVNMLRIKPHQRCPVNLKYNPRKTLVYMACRAFFVRDDLNLKTAHKIHHRNNRKSTALDLASNQQRREVVSKSSVNWYRS